MSFKWITNKDLVVYSRKLWSVLSGSLDVGVQNFGKDEYVYECWLST